MGSMTKRMYDSFANFVSKIGMVGSKEASNTYILDALTQQEIEAAYRSSWLARKIIDIPPLDMTREWRNWQAEDDQIEEIENEEKRLGYAIKVRRALTWGRLYGGAAIVMGVNNAPLNTPLEVESVREGQLKFLHVLHRYNLTSAEYELDPMSEFFGQPKVYNVRSAATGSVQVHPSRVIRFLGNEVPDPETNAEGWSDSYWSSLKDIVGNTDLLTTTIATLVHEAKIDVITVPDLMTLVTTQADEDRLVKRMTLGMAVKATNNAILLDGGSDGKSGEKWERKEMQFVGLEGILRLFLVISSGAADIPATRFLGKSPDGLNASGESDLRNYYDMLSSKQNLEMWPNLAPLDEVMLRSLGYSDKDIDGISFESAPLWQMTPTEKAAIAKQKADTSKVYSDMGVINVEAFAAAVQNQLLEDQTYPGLEQAIEEHGDEPEEPLPPPALLPAPPGARPALPAPAALATAADHILHQDAAPRSLDPTNTGAIRKGWKMTVTQLLKKAETRTRALIRSHEGVGLDAAQFRSLLGQTLDGPWYKKYVVRAYRRGIDDATHKLGQRYRFPFSERDTMSINALMARAQRDFDNVADELAAQLDERVKASTSVDEALSSAKERFKAIGQVRGHLVAGVHSVAAHAKGTLSHFAEMGVTHVGAVVEGVPSHGHGATLDEDLLQFATAGDNDVCPECEDLEGNIYTLEEAEGIIPVHPECRCSWIPIRDPSGRFNPRIGADSLEDGDFIQDPETGLMQGSEGGGGGGSSGGGGGGDLKPIKGVKNSGTDSDTGLSWNKTSSDTVIVNGEKLNGGNYEVKSGDTVVGTVAPTSGNAQTALSQGNRIASGRGEVLRWRASPRGGRSSYHSKFKAALKELARYKPKDGLEDASPRSLYIRRDVLNADEIIAWAKEQGFTSTLPASDMHVTVCYSKSPIDWMKVGESWSGNSDGTTTIRPGGARIVERLGPSAVVLLFTSNELTWRHEAIKHAGASSDYEDYQPHVTITYQPPEGMVFDEVEPYRGEIRLGVEIFEEVTDGVNHEMPEERTSYA